MRSAMLRHDDQGGSQGSESRGAPSGLGPPNGLPYAPRNGSGLILGGRVGEKPQQDRFYTRTVAPISFTVSRRQAFFLPLVARRLAVT